MNKEKIKSLLYKVYNEFDNELDFNYTSEFKKDLTNNDLNMLFEFLERFINKVNLIIDDEWSDKKC